MNRLADASSPYLRQHRDNPVDWFPWGEEAFEKAREEDKPIFLSIGYSTCHWCHVMEAESFEDEAVARLMNETFVAIKVDREERPDIDGLYMDVCQMMNGQGGWPLNVVLTPDKKPFYAATYIPKEGRFGRVGMLELVPRIRELWAERRDEIVGQAEHVTDTLREAAAQAPSEDDALAPGILHAAAERLAGRFDAAHGGFGSAPKFPSPHHHLFLLRYHHRLEGQGDNAAEALPHRPLGMVTATLDAMRRGGLWDHVGYGFHRYATDRTWLVPHFEKMLYDQATHLMAYVEAYQVTGRARYAATARQIATYVRRDLTAPEGGFYAAEDADSLNADGEKEEGAFYVWTAGELRDVLGDDLAALVIDVMGAEDDGNYAEEATRRKTGANILHQPRPVAEAAATHDLTEAALRERLERARRRLLARRADRPRPGLDDKILTDWNGLMVAALAKAARALGSARIDPDGDAPTDCLTMATDAAGFLLATMRDDEGRLLHRYRAGEAGIRAHLDDLAFLAWGLVELYEATFAPRWLEAALALVDELRAHYHDDARGGFYVTADDAEALLVRRKETHDGAMPSGSSAALSVLLRLARLTGRTELEDDAAALVRAAAAQVRKQPMGFTALLCGYDFAVGPAREVVVAGPPADERTQALVRAVHGTYAPRTVALLRPDGEGVASADAEAVTALAPFTEAQRVVDGQPAAYVCRDFACAAPTTDPEALRDALEAG